jgi:hypothetical protein
MGAIKKKAATLHQDNNLQEMPSGHLRHWPDLTHSKLKGLKEKTHLKNFPLGRKPQASCWHRATQGSVFPGSAT